MDAMFVGCIHVATTAVHATVCRLWTRTSRVTCGGKVRTQTHERDEGERERETWKGKDAKMKSNAYKGWIKTNVYT